MKCKTTTSSGKTLGVAPRWSYYLSEVFTRGEQIFIFQLLIHIRKNFAYPYPILIRKFLKFSIRYPSISECDTG